nr:MogA/MoaB family molybdenum cofactor biosynthesis protein [Microbacterium lemovicicum]
MSHHHEIPSENLTATVITVSDRTAAGERSDGSGPIAVAALTAAGWTCAAATVVPDGADSVEAAVREALAEGARLVVTTGGTGVSPRDQTPEGTRGVIDREVPGIAEELRRADAAVKPTGMLARGLVGVVDPTGERSGALVVNLPGSPNAVETGMPIVLSVAAHIVAQLGGGDH